VIAHRRTRPKKVARHVDGSRRTFDGRSSSMMCPASGGSQPRSRHGKRPSQLAFNVTASVAVTSFYTNLFRVPPANKRTGDANFSIAAKAGTGRGSRIVSRTTECRGPLRPTDAWRWVARRSGRRAARSVTPMGVLRPGRKRRAESSALAKSPHSTDRRLWARPRRGDDHSVRFRAFVRCSGASASARRPPGWRAVPPVDRPSTPKRSYRLAVFISTSAWHDSSGRQ
jgi:hypothetical protein